MITIAIFTDGWPIFSVDFRGGYTLTFVLGGSITLLTCPGLLLISLLRRFLLVKNQLYLLISSIVAPFYQPHLVPSVPCFEM